MRQRSTESFIASPSSLPVAILAACAARSLQALHWWLHRPLLWVPFAILLWQKLHGFRIIIQ